METAPESSAHRTARARARDELTREIVETARRRLAEDGAAGLSLRAIARDLGMVSSALYRYFPSRDHLLTRLIIDAYDALGAAAEKAEQLIPRDDLKGRFAATCNAVRGWAIANPQEYALIYGSPVPGYRAPNDTIAPATRTPTLLITILVDSVMAGRAMPVVDNEISDAARASLVPLRPAVPSEVPDALLVRGLLAYSSLFGVVSFELFGQLHNVIDESAEHRQAFFDAEVAHLAHLAGVA